MSLKRNFWKSLLKIKLLLVSGSGRYTLHKDQITVCHTNWKPLLIFFFVAVQLTQSKRYKRFDGITITNPNHLKTSYHTKWATLRWRNKWLDDSVVHRHHTWAQYKRVDAANSSAICLLFKCVITYSSNLMVATLWQEMRFFGASLNLSKSSFYVSIFCIDGIETYCNVHIRV
jgi:hypothetical protein